MRSSALSLLGLWLLTSALCAQEDFHVPAALTDAHAILDGAGIRALQQPSSLRSGLGVQPGAEAGSHLITGPDYSALIGSRGLEFTPILGSRAPTTQQLGLSFAGVSRGAAAVPVGAERGPLHLDGMRAERSVGAGIVERFDIREAGVELSYLFPSRPLGAGDLAVTLALDSTFLEPRTTADGALEFFLDGVGGVRIGAVTGIDANGHQVAGKLRFEAGHLELSLPGDFVDGAAYPLVLDPLVGSVFPVSSDSGFATLEDTRPDLAYDVTSDLYLIVWERTFSATDSRIFARRFSSSGAAFGGIFQLSSSIKSCRNPAVANVDRADSFVVVWQCTENVLGSVYTEIQMILLEADFQAAGSAQSVANALTQDPERLNSPDVCGEGVVADSGLLADFVVVWDDDVDGRIGYRHYGFDGNGALVSTDSIKTLVSDTVLTKYGEPSIAKASGAFNRAVVVATAFNNFAPSSIRGWVMNLNGSVQGNGFTVSSSLAGDARNPDIDGFDRQWVCAWEQDDANGNSGVNATTISLPNPTGTATVATATVIASPVVLSSRDRPAVGFTFGKSWIGWRSTNFLGTPSIQLRGYDSTTCTSCEGPFTLTTSNGAEALWVAVATTTSGGAYSFDKACVAFSFTDSTGSDDLSAQFLANNAQLGTTENLGGGCGNAGTVNFTGAPSIGSSWWYNSINNLPPTTLAAFYNFSTANPGLAAPCGPCVWMPFEISGSAPIQFESGNLVAYSPAFTIPCNASLVGAQVTVQWTTLNPVASPCSAVPGFSVSDRWRATIGQ